VPYRDGVRRSLVLGLLLVSACSGHSATTATTTTAATPRTITAPTRPAPTQPTYAVTQLSAPLTFTSADGNLGCDIESAYARCDPAHRAWGLPPAPSDCASGWGHGIELQAGSRASFFCGSDSVAGGKRVLAPGHAFAEGFVQCEAVTAATIRCHGTTDDHGFTISRTGYRLT
jgi:hypothetical protein